MFQVSSSLDLTQASLRQDFLGLLLDTTTNSTCSAKAYLGVDIGDLLNGARFASPTVLSGDDATVSALTEFFHELVVGIDDEGRVERGEGTALHDGGQGQRRGRFGCQGFPVITDEQISTRPSRYETARATSQASPSAV